MAVMCFILSMMLTVCPVLSSDTEPSSIDIEEVLQELSTDDQKKADSQKPAKDKDTLDTATMMTATASTSSGGGAGGGQSTVSTNISQFAGAASAGIPILVPPGRNGIAPNLNLSYNSTGKNGALGIGWSLEVGTIQRQSKLGIDYTGEDFIFANSEASFDIVRRHDWGSGYYGAKIEGGFLKFYLDSSTNGWVVTGKDGLTYYYGIPDSITLQGLSSGVWTAWKTPTETTCGSFIPVTSVISIYWR